MLPVRLLFTCLMYALSMVVCGAGWV